MARLRLVFMGTPALAASCLSSLLGTPDVAVLAAVSQPDRPKGRHLQRTPTPVKQRALEAGVPVLQPETAREPAFLARLKELAPDLIVVAAYGQILPQALLDIPTHGCVNVHTSLLPRYRGAAPIQWALLNGDRETGVTLMKMVVALDAGDIIRQAITPITDQDDAVTLHDRLATIGGDLLVNTLPDYVAGRIKPTPQPAEGMVHARKIRKEDGLVNWTRSAAELWNQVRALVPWPVAFTHLPASAPGVPPSSSDSGERLGTLLKLWKAKPADGQGSPGQVLRAEKNEIVVGCGSGALRIDELQREGGRRLTTDQFLAGHPLTPGQRLG